MPLEPVTDPDLLQQLNAGAQAPAGLVPVTDPELLKQLNGPEQAPATSDTIGAAVKYWIDGIRAIHTGLVRGGTGLIGLPADLANLITDKLAAFGHREPGARIPLGASDIQGAAGFTPYKPQTPVGEWAEPIAQGVSSMVGSGPGGLALGATSGAGGELGRRFAGAPGQFAGNVAPFIASLLYAFTPKASIRALQGSIRESLPDLPAAAAAKAVGDQALGAPTLLTHYLDPASPLASAVQEASGTMAGSPIRAALVKERTAMAGKTGELVAGTTPEEVGLAARQKVFNALAAGREDPYAALSQADQFKYGQAKFNPPGEIPDVTLPENVVSTNDIAQALIKAANEKNLIGTPGGAAMGRVANQVGGGRIWPGQAPVLNMDALARLMAMQGGSASQDLAKGAGLTAGASAIKDLLKESSPALAVAKGTHQMGMEQSVAPMEQGAVGVSLPAKAAEAGTADWPTMLKVVKDPLSTPHDIRTLAAGMTSDPSAFPTLLKRAFLEAGQDASPTQFIENVAGKPGTVDFANQRAGFIEKVTQAQLANGLSSADAAQAAKGAAQLADTINAVGRGQQSMPHSVQTHVMEKAGETISGDLVKIADPKSFMSKWFLINKMAKAQQERVMRQFSEIITSPAAVDKLKEIAAYSNTENALFKTVRALNSIEAQSN